MADAFRNTPRSPDKDDARALDAKKDDADGSSLIQTVHAFALPFSQKAGVDDVFFFPLLSLSLPKREKRK